MNSHKKNRMKLCMALAVAVLIFGPAMAPANDKKEFTSEKWAKQIAQTFLEGVLFGETSVYGLLSPELVKIYDTPQSLRFKFVDYREFSIDSQESAPDKSELVFQGTLKPINEKAGDSRFIMRVAKEAQGRWSIRYLSIRLIP